MNEKTTILLVDDEDHIRMFFRTLLTQAGNYRLIEAANGVEAVELFQSRRPDAVMMDVNMPEMDGVETLRKIREIDGEAVVIMLTAKATEYTVRECMEAGAANFIRKDNPKERIVSLLQETLIKHGLGEPK